MHMDTTQSPLVQPDRRCPRCRVVRRARFFQPPLLICLVCYSTAKGSAGLNVEQLRAKAKRARRGRMEAQLARRLAVTSDIGEDVEVLMPDTIACDGCGKQVRPQEFRGDVCNDCLVKRPTKDPLRTEEQAAQEVLDVAARRNDVS